jgi:hypothetical protein
VPVLYQRDALLVLAQSPLVATCGPDARGLARLSAILSADASPSSAQAGTGIKGSPLRSIYPATIHEHAFGDQTPISAMTANPHRGHHKTLSYSAIQFNHERYAAVYSTPFTPDPSLMKPVNMSEWTPSMTTPLNTPFGDHQNDSGVAVDSGYPSVTETEEQNAGKEKLRSTAKVFIPTDTPLLKDNPQPKRNTLHSSRHTSHQAATWDYHPKTRSTDRSFTAMPSQSLPVTGPALQFEAPKAMTPLAAPSAGLPARPTACAVAPNLPRWAHSPAHAMISSMESKYMATADYPIEREPSLIRRARASTLSQDSTRAQSTHSRKSSDAVVHPSGISEATIPLAPTSTGSRTPWALQRTAAELDIKGDAVYASSRKSPTAYFGYGMNQVSSPTPLSSAASSRAIQVNNTPHVKAFGSFDGNSWRKQIQGSFSQPPRKPSLTPSIPGGLLGAVPMHSVSIK